MLIATLEGGHWGTTRFSFYIINLSQSLFSFNKFNFFIFSQTVYKGHNIFTIKGQL